MRARRPALVAALAVLLAACQHGPRAFRCEAHGGSAWRQLRSAHFVVATDVSGPRGEALVRELEQLHALVVQAMVGDHAEIPGKVHVVAFADPSDFERIARPGSAGYMLLERTSGSMVMNGSTVVFPVQGFQADPEVIAHELAHEVAWHVFPRQPSWFAEGIAQFVETVARPREQALAPTGTHVARGGREAGGRWAGLAPARIVQFLQEAGGGMPDDLLSWSSTGGGPAELRYYAWSWLLYHWMWNTRTKAFGDFTNRLANAEDPVTAWRAAFPDLDPASPGGTKALSDALETYRRGGRFVAYQVKAPFDATFSVAPLPPAEVHVVLLTAQGLLTVQTGMVDEMQEAAREDPLHPLVLFTSAPPGERPAAMRRAVEARPGDWRAWFLLARVLSPGTERDQKEAAYRRAVELNPENAAARNGLAWTLNESGRPREALTHANAAVDLAPWYAPAIDTLATVASNLGKCREARILQRRAIALVHSQADRAGYQEHLARIDARCAADVAPAAPR